MQLENNMNPFIDDKSALAIIATNSGEETGESDKGLPAGEDITEVAMKGLMKAISKGDTKKAIQAFKALMDLCDDMGDTEETDDKMEF